MSTEKLEPVPHPTGDLELDLDTICGSIEQTHFNYANEDELQQGLFEHLYGWDVKREVRLDARNRVDLVVTTNSGNIGIEVKVKGNTASALKQVLRYAHFDSLAAVVLVTNRKLAGSLPLELNGKPIRVVSLLHRGL